MAALWRIVKAWELDWFDATALIGESTKDLTTIVWTEDRLLRVAYLMAIDNALVELHPRTRISRWIATPKPGPFFRGNSPLQVLAGGPHEMRALLRQIASWSEGRP